VQRKQGHYEILVQEKPIRLLADGVLYLRTQAKQGLYSGPRIDTHPEVHHDQIGKRRKIDSLSLDRALHSDLLNAR
jgi:hypothetical protein